jgi:DNA-binding transcriptional ArsR family regulator
VSAVLFGNRHKLELLTALVEAGDDGVSLSDVADAQGVAASVYYGPLRPLIDAGLVERLGRRAEGRRCWYRRRENAFWGYVEVIIQGLAEVEVEAP